MTSAVVALCIAMSISPAFLAELARRRPSVEQVAAKRDLAAEAAVRLRSRFDNHPKQRAFFTSKHKQKCTRKTRRAGATDGGCRELLARALEIPGFRATYVASTRIEAKQRAWESDSKSGLVDVLREYGTLLDRAGVTCYELGGIVVEVREQDLTLEFSNGGQIELFGADDERRINKKRGGTKHVFWIDEAQDFRFLDRFYKAVVVAALTDFGGEIWITGTPGRDCSGLFFNISNEEEPLIGWEVHAFAVTDNPFFGHVVWEASTDGAGQWFVEDNLKRRHGPFANEVDAETAATAIRWENTAGKAMRENGWAADDPDLQREWYARWVRGDASYVYPVHVIPIAKLTFAPMRLRTNPFVGTDPRFIGHPKWYDHDAAVLDLPKQPNRKRYEWLYAIGVDFGYFPDPFAVVVWAFTFERPDIFEMFSWKQQKVLPDDQRCYVELLWNAINNIVVLVGDPGGKKGDLEAWRTRFNLPIDDADKSSKNTYQELMAGDIRKGNVHYREGSPLLHEHMHLVYLPTKPGKTRIENDNRKIADGTVPGRDCSDAGLYSHRHLNHHLHREQPKDQREVDMKRADDVEEAVDRGDVVRAAMEAEGDYDDGGYGYG